MSTTAVMLKHYFAIITLLFVISNANGQQRWISGYLRDSSTHFPIAKGTISNPAEGKKIETDVNGFFRIRVSSNDLLYAFAPSYRYDTLRYSILYGDTLTMYLAPLGNVLAGVTVRSQYTKYQLDSMNRRAAFEEMRGKTLNAIASNRSTGFGLTFNLDRFTKKKYRNKKKEENLFEKTERMAYINYRFSPQLVASVTGLKGDSLRRFMFRFTPAYEWLREHPSDDDVFYYINDKLKEYNSTLQKQ
jgi:hypothetical protein